ncbi:SEC7-like guanine nucleotide exchange family protein [Zostera marina]|uniref:SEC7-like guanine nucleotide exchange family protein n=1 Tax=Zostera marina TaxID=29655 RepID=A0A0K9NVS0_ZOSMR|nr:SEC7-like guanine nucleotide exchange family protein [Zostera marina]
MGYVKLHSGAKTDEETEVVHRGCDDMVRGTALSCIINSEVSAVLSVMRRNIRWAGRYMAGDEQLEHSLIQSLKTLKKQMFSWGDQWHTIDPVIYLQPFLDVIQSDETSAPIVSIALSSVYKILTLEIFNLNTVNVDKAMHLIVDSVTSCRFDVTDASEEAEILMILQVLLSCMKNKASVLLSNQHVSIIVKTCFRVVCQADNKGELLQKISRNTIHELIRCIFLHLQNVEAQLLPNDASSVKSEDDLPNNDISFGIKQINNGNGSFVYDAPETCCSIDKNRIGATKVIGDQLMTNTYGVPCVMEIFNILFSLLNISENLDMGPRSNTKAFEEDMPLFALGLINSAIESGGSSLKNHPKLLALVQDELFRNLMQFGLSTSPSVLSMVCSIALNLYHHLRSELKLQLEAFFSCIILRHSKNRHPASFQQQEVAMEALVDFCMQKDFMAEMYANLDCDITCSNVFECLSNLLSKGAFPVNCPLSSMHLLALDGLLAVIQGMAGRINNASLISEQTSVELREYTPFWTLKCENYSDPNQWVGYVRRRKYIKRRLMIGADHFNRDPKKGLEFLQGTHLLPDKLDPQSVACFFRYTSGLDKNLVGDFLGNHDEFCVQVLHEFAGTFDFQDMSLDTSLRLFLETFRLPGESQKIQRVLEAFSERYYDQSPHILANMDAALVLSYSLIMLNTDQHNVQVKKKMTEEDFIRNNRSINDGNDLPRDYLSELYHAICKNELKTIPEQGAGFPEMTPSRWIDLMQKSKSTSPYISYGSCPYLDRDMFAMMSGPTIAAISVVFEHAEQEEVFRSCVSGFLALAKISACHHLEDVLDDLVVSLCRFTTLTNSISIEEPVSAFGDDLKARLATETVFSIVNQYGDFIHTGWRNILDCILRLHKLGLLPARVASDASDDTEPSLDAVQGKPVLNSQSLSLTPTGTPRMSSGLMGRFSQLLSLETEEPRSQPSEQQLASHQRTVHTIQKCHIDSIFTESKLLKPDSLRHLARALVWPYSRSQKNNSSPDDEDTAVFCLELLIAITLNNRDRISLLWQGVYDHTASIVQSTFMPCPLVEKAVFGLFKICQRLIPYNENLADELLKSLQLILKLDTQVADAYRENITQEVTRLVKANATRIKSHMGWKTITDLLSITARYLESSEAGFEVVTFIMTDGAFLTPANYILFVDSARQFAESRVSLTDRSIRALGLMADSTACLVRWSLDTNPGIEGIDKTYDPIKEMWSHLVKGLRKMCLDPRDEVRNQGLSSLIKCMIGMDGICITSQWQQSFDTVVFGLLDDLLKITQQGQSPKEYKNIETTLVLAMKFLSKLFLHFLKDLSALSGFCKLWLGVLDRMDKYMNVKFRGKSEKLHELIPDLLQNILVVMKARGILVQRSAICGDSLWELTWLHVNNIAPSLKSEVFPGDEYAQDL